ncbi:MAG: RnfABCDGE type electron transport complex subunit D [Treponema sp.]|nr:RnfABCDGE type electron transport complex subunit D [Treponema sp.]
MIQLSSSPHIASKITTRHVMWAVVISMLPEAVYGVILFGIPALLTICASVATAIVSEFLFNKITGKKQTVTDGSAAITGLLLALVLPPTLPLWQTILGAAFAIIVAKQLFGGLGSNVWNPALTGRAFLFASFPAAMGANWISPLPDAVSSATILSTLKQADAVTSATTVGAAAPIDYLALFFGRQAGCIGESSIMLILISAVFLIATKIVDWRTPVFMVGTFALLMWISGGDVLAHVLSGGLVFGAVFMATDYVTSPVTAPGRIVFGAGCGLLTFLIRKFGGYPEGVMFSILIMNSIVPFLNKLTPRMYGYKKQGGSK